jgi:hypothetical protein
VLTVGTGAISQSTLSYPNSVYTDGTRLLIAQWSTPTLIYNRIPTSSGALADYVLGAPDFNSAPAGTSASLTYGNDGGASFFDGFIYLTDKNNDRILGFDLSSLSNGMNATRVAGEPDYVSAFSNPGIADGTAFDNLIGPIVVKPDPNGKYVWIADRWGYRVIRVLRSAWSKYAHP